MPALGTKVRHEYRPTPVDDRAACDGTDPEAWFPLIQGTDSPRAMEKAAVPLRRICRECPLRTACRKLALESEGTTAASGRHGIFGGWTPRQRARIAQLSGVIVEADPDVQGDLFDLDAS